jgi:putative acetyltransferase
MEPKQSKQEADLIERSRGFLSPAARDLPRIRRASLTDCGAIMEAAKAAIATVSREYYSQAQIEGWLARRQVQDYQTALQSALVFVAECGDEVVGFAALDPSSGVIQALYVDPEHVGRGVGRALLSDLEAEARRTGLPRVYVEATLNSVAFYQARGYLPLSSQPPQPDAALPCVVMEKSL